MWFFFFDFLKTNQNRRRNMAFLDKFFGIKARDSSITAEVVGGIVTFLAMVYILPVNSFMLANTGMSQPGVFVATALAAGIATILMGIVGKVPIALASGMGINAFFTCFGYFIFSREFNGTS
jgi:AGZA family xanthine/uracil permease-like MFS transporter